MDISAQLINIITSTSDSEELKNKIVKKIATELKASQCFFVEYDSTTHNFKKITNLYSPKRENVSLLGYDFEKNLKHLAVKLKYMDFFVVEDTDLFVAKNKLGKTKECKYFKDFEVKAFLAVRLSFGEIFSGVLAINYDEKKEDLQKTDLQFLKNIAGTISIALHLCTLYTNEKHKGEREKLLNSIISIMSESYDLNSINQKAFAILGKVYNTQSIYVNIDTHNFKKFYFYNFSKNRSEEFKDYEKNALLKIYDSRCFNSTKNKTHYIPNIHHFIISNNLENSPIEKYFEKNNVNSIVLFPVLYEFISYGLLIIHFDKTNPIAKDDLELIRTVATELGIIVKQAMFYEKEKIALEREKILRTILNKSISTFDINQIKPIVKEVGIIAKADRCYFVEANQEELRGKQIHYDGEYLASPDIKSVIGYTFPPKDVHKFVELFVENKDLVIFDYEEIIKTTDEEYKGMREFALRFETKSGIGIPLFYEGKLHAVLAIEYVKEKVLPTEDESEFYRILGNNASMVLNQIKLYENTKKTAERERINRNIIEILRSSIDKFIIKKLFVENIGKFFNADRVLLSEYDSSQKKYLPADGFAEYLADPNEKSMQGFDWSKPEISEFIQPLLEKREVNIFSWDEYVKQNKRGEGFTNFFESYNIKSSYNFPIIYQHQIMGFFCIDFTEKANILSDEDINRIRSMCTQAGIALFHAELYNKANKCLKSRESFIKEIKKPTNEILDISVLLSENDFEHTQEIKYLNKIINSCDQILNLTEQNLTD